MPLILTPTDLQSATWKKIREQIEDDIENLRDKLESPLLSTDDTNLLRGEIKRLRAILSVQPKKLDIVDDQRDYG